MKLINLLIIGLLSAAFLGCGDAGKQALNTLNPNEKINALTVNPEDAIQPPLSLVAPCNGTINGAVVCTGNASCNSNQWSTLCCNTDGSCMSCAGSSNGQIMCQGSIGAALDNGANWR